MSGCVASSLAEVFNVPRPTLLRFKEKLSEHCLFSVNLFLGEERDFSDKVPAMEYRFAEYVLDDAQRVLS